MTCFAAPRCASAPTSWASECSTLRLLAYGGSAHPEAILREAGVDIADPAFWQGGFDVIGEMIDQLEALAI